MVVFDILQKLSFSSGEKLLLEEGYVEEKCIKREDSSCDMLFLYPYCLRDNHGNLIDCIYLAEYCDRVVDDEYIDGRMTWEPIKASWIKG